MNDGTMTPADVAAVTGNNGGFGDGNSAWVLIILFALIFGNGNWFGGRSNGESVTEAGLCNSMNFNNLENSVGRLSDQMSNQNQMISNALCQNGYETLSNFNTTQNLINNGFSSISQQLAQCCCDTQRQIDNVNYNNAMNTAAIQKTTTEQTQKILDTLCGNRMADMQNQINQLQLQSAMNGVVRYPNGWTYNAGNSPFCGCNTGCCNI